MEWQIWRYGRVRSTMDIAAELAEAGAAAGTVVVADEQTAGRGRLGRVWLAPPGVSLLMTALFRPPLSVARRSTLSREVAAHVADAVTEVTGVVPTIKEPNDLLVDGKKLSGILIQTSIRGDQLDYLLIGIGLNVNLDPADLPFPNVTSLRAITGEEQDREALLAAILKYLPNVPGLTVAGD